MIKFMRKRPKNEEVNIYKKVWGLLVCGKPKECRFYVACVKIFNTQKVFMPCIKQEYQNNVLIEKYTITILSSVCGQIFKRFLERNEITILLRTVVGKI